MNKMDRNRARQELRDFLPHFPEDETFAVTLTMKQNVMIDGYHHRLDRISASKNLRHFLNRLNRAAFGNAARRYERTVRVIPALERSHSGRLHYHLAIQNPRSETPFFFKQRIKDCWQQTTWADAEIRYPTRIRF